MANIPMMRRVLAAQQSFQGPIGGPAAASTDGPFGLTTWTAAFWADDPDLVKPGDGNALATWRDGGTEGKDMTQGTGDNQPVWNESVAAFNNRATVVGDGSDDYMQSATWSAALSQANTVVCVGRFTGTSAYLYQSADGTARHSLQRAAGGGFRVNAGSNFDPGTGDGDVHAFMVVYDGASSEIAIDGSVYALGNPGTEGMDGITLGSAVNGSAAGKFEVAFLGVHDGRMPVDERAALWDWISSYYGTDLAVWDPTERIDWASIFYADDTRWATNPGDGLAMADWRDGGTNAADLAQASGTLQPLWIADGGAGFNNQGIVRGDGSDDYMQTAAWSAALSQPNTVVCVGKTTATNAYILNSADASAQHIMRRPAAGNWLISSDDDLGAGQGDSNEHYFYAVFADPASVFEKEDGPMIAGSTGTEGMDGITLGAAINGTVAGKFEVAFLAVYDGVLTLDQRAELDAWIATTYGFDVWPNHELRVETVDGSASRVWIPTGTRNGKLVMFFHGSGGDEETIKDANWNTLLKQLLTDGYIVAASDGEGDSWGTTTAQADFVALQQWVIDRWQIDETVILAGSMGGIASLLIVAADSMVNVTHWAGLYPAIDLDDMYNNSTAAIQTQIDTAYDIPGGGDYDTQTAGHDPILLDASSYAGCKFKMWASPSDGITSIAPNAEAFRTLVSGVADVDIVYSTGSHGDASHFDAAALSEFYATTDAHTNGFDTGFD